MQKSNKKILNVIRNMALKQAIPEEGWPPTCQTIFYQSKRPKELIKSHK